VIVADLNLLLYATNADAPQHPPARAWWHACLQGEEAVGLAWTVVLGFLRIATSARVFARPISVEQALEAVQSWLEHPHVQPLEPTDRHWEVLRELLADVGTAGDLTMDAHLAALAIEHGARLHSTDADFGRFRHVRWSNPIAGPR